MGGHFPAMAVCGGGGSQITTIHTASVETDVDRPKDH